MKVVGIAAAAAVLASGGAYAQSSKFAAIYDTDNVTVADVDGSGAEMDLATIRVPNKKEMLITVSGEVRIVTFTAAKGNNKTAKVTSTADGSVDLEVVYAPKGTPNICDVGTVAEPGAITLASREQTLAVDVTTTNLDDEDAIIEVLVELTLDTTAAHSFQFLAPNVEAGEYDVAACFDLGSSSTADDGSTFVALQKRIMTIQEVRAINSAVFEDGDVVDVGD